jgi:hypothetical protein
MAALPLVRRSAGAGDPAPGTTGVAAGIEADAAGRSGAHTDAAASEVLLLQLVRWRDGAAAWGLSRLVLGPRALGRAPGLRFARVLGSGRNGGFGLAPGFDRQGVAAFFADEAGARAFAAHSPALRARRDRSQECLLLLCRASAARGSWAGHTMAVTAPPAAPGQPVAALTRASIRPRHARAFWSHTPAAQAALDAAPGCRLAAGLGEAPLLRQATFSLWDDAASMEAFARRGAHRQASADAMGRDWFSESMFVRLVPIAVEGTWHGRRFG